jgi:starch synthase
MIKVLAVASEVFPLVKTGGLADVVGALPDALQAHGVTSRVLVPGYPAVMAALKTPETIHTYATLFGGPASLVAAKAAGLSVIALDAPHLFNRPGNPYLGPDGKDWPDNAARFAALCRAAADFGEGRVAAFVPDIVHSHDWQAALAAVYLAFAKGRHAASLLTVHNLAFQGTFPSAVFESLGLPAKAFAIDGVEYYGGIGFLKGGLQLANAIATVSPTYATEICTPAGGMGLDGLLRSRRSVLTGILNGVDTEVWDPGTDANLAAKYSAATLSRRGDNRRSIEAEFNLASGSQAPLFCVVSRLTWQKGMDVLGGCIDDLVARGAQLAVLGSGDAALEGMFRAAAARHPGRVGVVTGYDERLSHLLQGGSDAILVPSRFEPCGLTQFYGLRYGCVPVVARVGGLADSIVDANDAALTAAAATGIQFLPVDTTALGLAIERAIILHGDRRTWAQIQKRGMKADVSWKRSASRHAALYGDLVKRTAAA